jgi:hypothetical protein
VVDELGIVRGVFSLEAFAKRAARGTLADWKSDQCAPGDWAVSEVLEHFRFAHLDSEMDAVFDSLEKDNAVLVGGRERLVGILTPVDVLKYLYQVASPYVLVSEIELALRALIDKYLTAEDLKELANKCLAGAYRSRKMPTSLDEMSFDNYRTLICSPDAWGKWFGGVFAGNYRLMDGKLKRIADIRNELFHFRRRVTIDDHQLLTQFRNQLMIRIELEDARDFGEQRK